MHVTIIKNKIKIIPRLREKTECIKIIKIEIKLKT